MLSQEIHQLTIYIYLTIEKHALYNFSVDLLQMSLLKILLHLFYTSGLHLDFLPNLKVFFFSAPFTRTVQLLIKFKCEVKKVRINGMDLLVLDHVESVITSHMCLRRHQLTLACFLC